MALGRNGNIIIVRNNGNHTINDLYNANTSRVRRQGVDGARQYHFFNSTIRIEGNSTLTIDHPCLFNDNPITKIDVNNGTLRIGNEQTLNGLTAASGFRSIAVNFRGSNIDGNDAWKVPSSSQLRVRAAGRLELLNAFVTLEEGNIAIQSGGVFYCRNSIVYSNGSNNSDSNGPRILMETENVDIDGLVITSERGNFQSIAFFRPPQPGVKNFKPIHCLLGVQFNNATNGTEFSIDARGNGEYVTFSQFGVVDRTVFVESLDGALLSARSKDLSPYMSWALLQFINWKINIRDADGPTTAFLYLKDFYNGADRRYVYASLAHENQKEYRESIPASGEVDLRLTVALSDRNLQIDPSPLIELDPPLDDRRPIFGWLRKYGHFQAAVTINSLISGVQGYLLVRNRAISLSQPDADAITGVSITVHDTPVDWNGLQWSITIEVDGPTANQAWQWVHSQQTKNSPLAGGLDGMQLHEMWPSVAQTDSGIYFDNASQTTFRRGVRVITATGDPLQGVTSMEADDENVYNPPTSVVLTIRNIIPGSELVLKIGTFILFKVDPTGNTAAYGYVYPGFDQLVDVFINQEGYEFFVNKGIVLGLTNQSLRAEQVVSSGYSP